MQVIASMAKKTTFSQKYWFAIGYHHAMIGIKETQSSELAEFLRSTLNIDIVQLYSEGWERGSKDKAEGLE